MRITFLLKNKLKNNLTFSVCLILIKRNSFLGIRKDVFNMLIDKLDSKASCLGDMNIE